MSTVIVGGGLAGIAAARALHERGRDFVLLEATDRLGGRVRSFQTAEGFVLDRGFQVILDSYPTLRRLADFDALSPCYFASGARIFLGGEKFEKIVNPLRHIGMAWDTLRTPLFTPREKLGICLLGLRALLLRDSAVLGSRPLSGEASVAQLLAAHGVGEAGLRHFFQPFFGGVLLDPLLTSSAAVFLYYLKMFILGRAFIPARGMEQLPRNLANPLPQEKIHLHAEVLRIRIADGRAVAVQLTDGSEFPCSGIVLATEEPVTARLLSLRPTARPGRPVWTFYFSHQESTNASPWLVLNGTGGAVAHCVDLSAVSPALAPPGNHLLSATVLAPGGLDEKELLDAVRGELSGMLQIPSGQLAPLGHTMIPYGVPQQPPGALAALPRESGISNVWLAGDQITCACIEGALRSGWSAGIAASK